MDKQIILSVGREFGSAGHEIAEKIAKDLQISLYDRRLLDELVQEYGLNPKDLEKYDEKPRNIILSRSVRGHSNSISEAVAELQFKFLREKAAAGESFVIVGRCAEIVLADNEALCSVFILGDKESKIARVMEMYHLGRDEAEAKMKRHDKERKSYHNAYSKFSWGDSRGYDLCINSSQLGNDKTAELIKRFVFAKRGLQDSDIE